MHLSIHSSTSCSTQATLRLVTETGRGKSPAAIIRCSVVLLMAQRDSTSERRNNLIAITPFIGDTLYKG